MNNQEYWEKRKAYQMHKYMDEAEKTVDELYKLYKRASYDIQKKAGKIFEKYRSKHHLSKAEAERLLMKMNNLGDIKDILNQLKQNPDNKNLIAALESPAYSARLKALANLNNQLSIITIAIAKEESKQISMFLNKLAHDSYYQTIFNLQQYTDSAFTFKTLDKELVKQVLNTQWQGGNFSSRIWDNSGKLAKQVKKEIMLNLLTGRPLQDATKAIDNEFAKGYGNARRLVRTESAYISNQLVLKSYEACGVYKYIYVAILDLKTSQICRELDKKRFLVEKASIGLNYPPMHPWCRSTTIAWISDNLLKNLKQSAIDPVTGKRITVPGDMTYSQWYNLYVKNKPVAEAKEKSVLNKAADSKQYEKYREVLGSNVPENLVKFQKLKYNNSETWNELKKDYNVIKAIEKNKIIYDKGAAKNLYYKFKNKNIYASDHFIEDFIKRQFDSNGNLKYTFEDIVRHNLLGDNYIDARNNRLIQFHNKIATVRDCKDNKYISLMYRRKESPHWKKI